MSHQEKTPGDFPARQMSSMQSYYAGLAKTPLPTPAQVCALELGSSHLMEYFQDACGSCGYPIAKHAFEIATHIASRPAGVSSTRALCEMADRLKLAFCCRNLVMSPLVNSVVSADVGARYVALSVSAQVRASSDDAPPALSQAPPEHFLPPPALSGAK